MINSILFGLLPLEFIERFIDCRLFETKENDKGREQNYYKKRTNGFGIQFRHILFLVSYRPSPMYSIHAGVVMKFIAASA